VEEGVVLVWLYRGRIDRLVEHLITIYLPPLTPLVKAGYFPLRKMHVADTAAPALKTLYAPTRKLAAERLTEALAERNRNGGVVADDSLSVAEYLDTWLQSSARHSVKSITFEGYERYVRLHVKPTLGHVKLSKLTAMHLQNLYAQKLTELAPGSVRYLHAVIHRSLRQAHRWGLVRENVAGLVDPPQPRPKEIQPLDAEQTKRLLEAARDDDLEAFFVVAVTAGPRRGELLGLRWSDLNLDARTMRIQRTLSRAKSGPRYTPPKNGKGRSVKLAEIAVAALRRHRHRQNEARLKAGSAWTDEDLVFTTAVGGPLSPSVVDRYHHRPLLQRAGLPDIRIHDLRHTAASLLLQNNVHPKYVAETLGHANISITLDRYSHILPNMGSVVASAMDEALGL
jgi:integrase